MDHTAEWVNIVILLACTLGSAGAACAILGWTLSNKINAEFAAVRAEIKSDRESIEIKIAKLASDDATKRAEIYERMENWRSEWERKLEVAKAECDRRIEASMRAFGETVTAIREKVNEVERQLFGEFYRKEDLREVLDDKLGPIMRELQSIGGRVGAVEKVLLNDRREPQA